MSRYFDPDLWAAVPIHFWSLAFFIFGGVVGSFLNVCIHRLPRGLSLVSPGSRCPHCGHAIPWFLNIPLVTWLWLRGRCAHCRGPISIRYFLVELLTALLFLASWLWAGRVSVGLALAYCLVLAGLVVATFIDLEHFIIPDQITIGGMVTGFLCSAAVPALHGTAVPTVALQRSALGMIVGAGVVYLVLRLGKVFFGRLKVELAPESRIVFCETGLVLPGSEIPYEEIFYRKSDTIQLEARRVELVDRSYPRATIRLSPEALRINDDQFAPEQVRYLAAVADKLVLPREAMGFGDVKFVGAIGAFLGWGAALFSLMLSSIIGALVGVTFIALRKQEWSSKIPYGPYIALAVVVWMFGGREAVQWWLER